MKFRYLLIAGLAGLALVGCNKEEGVNDGSEGNGGNTYVTFNIYAPASDSPATKGAEGTPAFVNGSAEEAAIENIRFIFYRNGSKVAVSATDNFTPKAYQVGTVAVTDPLNPDPESAFDFQEEATGGSVERVAQAKVILKSNGAKPNQVLAFLNMEQKDFKEIADQPTLAQALEKMNDETLGSGIKPHNMFINKNNKFVMSNSAYFVGGLAGGAPTRAYGIKASAIKDSAAEAVNPSDAVTLYVDRVAAKVAVNTTAIDAGVVLPTTGDNKIVTSRNKAIKVTPLAWSLNAVQRDVYWTKDISYSPVYPWSLSTADVARQHRTWWAVDPNYNISTGQYGSYFPNSAYDHNSVVDNWKLYYYNTNEILAHSDKKIDGGASTLAEALALTAINIVDKGTTGFNTKAEYFEKQYCLENTLGTEVANYRRTATHVIVLAQATVEGNQVDLYRYNNTIYEEADWLDAIVGEVVGIQASKKFYTCPDADLSVAGKHAFTQLSKTDLKIEKAIENTTTHKVNKLPASKKHSDGDVSVFLTDVAKAKTWYVQIADFPAGFDPANDVNETNWSTYFSKITEPLEVSGEPNPANALADAITTVIEPTNAYTLGLLYYCVPVEHLVAKASTPEVGMYGMVRNHWYDITLDAIKGLGTGIYDPTEPIVPGDKTPDWYLAAKINVNAWHKIAQTSSLVD